MKIISHRGNLYGPNPDNENSPDYINQAIQLGYDVEIDVRVIDGKIYLGHDFPDYEVEYDYIKSIIDPAWFHCKNFESLVYFSNLNDNFKYFWHESDRFTITSNKFIWTYPEEKTSFLSIIVDLNSDAMTKNKKCYAVCADYILEYNGNK